MSYLGPHRSYQQDAAAKRPIYHRWLPLYSMVAALFIAFAVCVALVLPGCAAGAHQGSWGVALGRAEVSANCQYVRESKGDGMFAGGKNEELVEGDECFRVAGGPLSEGVLSAILAYFSWGVF